VYRRIFCGELHCGPGLHYSVGLRTQTVPLKYGKLATKCPRIYGYFFAAYTKSQSGSSVHESIEGRLTDIEGQRGVDVDADVASQTRPRHTDVVPRPPRDWNHHRSLTAHYSSRPLAHDTRPPSAWMSNSHLKVKFFHTRS